MGRRPLFKDLHVTGAASFSVCNTWRYDLCRKWGDGPVLVWIGLNPSTADAEKNDPTCERCMRRTRRLGYDAYIMLNLFAFRSTDPRKLRTAVDPIGPQNDTTLVRGCTKRDVVLAWGANDFDGRGEQVINLIRPVASRLFCLGKTQGGHPRHPLYVSYHQALEVWS